MTDSQTSGAPWAILPEALPVSLPGARSGHEPQRDAAAAPARPGGAPGGAAIVRLSGLILPRAPRWAEERGIATGCDSFARDVSRAADSHDAVVIAVDSPGGSVFGVQEAAAAVAAAAKRSHVVAVVSYLAASAAYWLASQADEVVVSPSSLTGSIGVITALLSTRRGLEANGIDTVVVSAGEAKTDGVPLVDIDDAAVERAQRRIDGYYRALTAAVAAGRGTTPAAVAELGAVVLGADAAVSAGLADRVGTLDEEIRSLTAGRRRRGASAATANAPATLTASAAQTAPARTAPRGEAMTTEALPVPEDISQRIDEAAATAAAPLLNSTPSQVHASPSGPALTADIAAQITSAVADRLDAARSEEEHAAEIAALRSEMAEMGRTLASRVPRTPPAAPTISDMLRHDTPNPDAVGAQSNGEFAHFAEFLREVHAEHIGRGRSDRLIHTSDPGIASVLTGESSDLGGALVPEEFRAQIMALAIQSSVLVPLVTTLPMGSSQVSLPVLRDTDHTDGSIYGGVRSYWLGVNRDAETTEPEFGTIELTAKTLITYTPVPNTLLADSAVTLPALIGMLFASSQAWTEDRAISIGSGAGEPLGFNGHRAAKTVSRSSASSTADTFSFDDVAEMEGALLPESAMHAVYVVTPAGRTAIIRMQRETGGQAPPISQDMPMTLFGRPVLPSEHFPALGQSGDISLIDPRFYLRGDRQAMTMSVSEHVFHQRNQTAFRMTSRCDGQPWISNLLTLANGFTVSPFVQLAA